MKYIPTIGIECHVQLKTKTKLFAAVGNDARGAAPNTLISHICLGMPGALPVLNEKAVDYAMRVAFAFNTVPQKYSYFERKHYFYPDLPKGYQITQLQKPIIVGGKVDIEVDGQTKTVRINRVQLEEDAGKNTHPNGKDYSLVDLNRAGTPLLEIVSEPDITSPAEAKAYVRELYLLMKYADVSDVDLYHGHMRFDVNVSVSKDPNKLGLRTETKNLNSFRSVEKAAEYEIKRQIDLLEKGSEVVQETRGWDDAKQKTIAQRSKEEAHDYRYMPDPDIPPIVLSDEQIETVRKAMPKSVSYVREVLRKLEIDSSAIETLIENMPASKIIMQALDNGSSTPLVKRVALWLAGDVQAYAASEETSWEALKLDMDALIKLSQLTEASKVSSTGAKSILIELIKNGGDPEEIAARLDVLQVSDEGEIEKIVAQVIADNPQAAADVKNGEMKAIGFLTGQVMKASKGKANPALAQKLIKKQLQ
jgi:aspartyl-tRNA(Asn)/glutamyl-tRNA(Gln) amidotransferase subunit B